jgi:hypothetical protein
MTLIRNQSGNGAIPRAYFGVRSNDTIAISENIEAASLLTGLVVEGSEVGWELEQALGGMRNVSGRTLEFVEGLISMHTVSTNASKATVYLYSETSTDNGSTWSKNAQSGRQHSVSGQTEQYNSRSSEAFNVADNAIVRFRLYTDKANITIEPVSFTAEGAETVEGPAIRWRLIEAPQ